MSRHSAAATSPCSGSTVRPSCLRCWCCCRFFLWRTRGRGGWRQNFLNRFGRFSAVPPKTPGVSRIWLQAVSVGELLAIEPLLEPLRRATGAEILLTTTTSTALALARERLSGEVLGPYFFPVDFWPWSARAWRTIAPDIVILAEGERWPEHLHQAERRGVPVVCVNARMSDRGFRRARRFRRFLLPCWKRHHPCARGHRDGRAAVSRSRLRRRRRAGHRQYQT